MKKTLILLVFIISMVLLASCGGNDSDKKTISPSASTSDTVKKETSSTKDVTTSDTVKKEPYVWYEYDDDGNVALKEYYNAEDELEKTESFLPNGSPQSVYEYNAEGMAVRSLCRFLGLYGFGSRCSFLGSSFGSCGRLFCGLGGCIRCGSICHLGSCGFVACFFTRGKNERQ